MVRSPHIERDGFSSRWCAQKIKLRRGNMLSFSPGRPELVDAVNLNHHPTEPTETPSPLSLQSPAAQPLQPPPSGGLWTHLHVADMIPHDGIDTFPDQDGTSQRLIDAAQRVKRAR